MQATHQRRSNRQLQPPMTNVRMPRNATIGRCALADAGEPARSTEMHDSSSATATSPGTGRFRTMNPLSIDVIQFGVLIARFRVPSTVSKNQSNRPPSGVLERTPGRPQRYPVGCGAGPPRASRRASSLRHRASSNARTAAAQAPIGAVPRTRPNIATERHLRTRHGRARTHWHPCITVQVRGRRVSWRPGVG